MSGSRQTAGGVSLVERARRYVATLPAAIAGEGGHNATFHAACVLVNGFGFSPEEAFPLLQEFSDRCAPPWKPGELEHKLRQAVGVTGDKPRGYLIGEGPVERGEWRGETRAPVPPVEKPEFDLAALEAMAGTLPVDLIYLANRSALDPSRVDAGAFLSALYERNEKVLIFINQMSQGDVVWPDEELPAEGREGVWYLAQPVDGRSYANPRTGKMSRRAMESVLAWRYLVLESDEAPVRLWLAAVAQMTLRIAAIYTSGGRSVHVLVRVDAVTKCDWDAKRAAILGAAMVLGADRGAMSAVRLTRLPGCLRLGKEDGSGRYVKLPRPGLQKLLYLCPEAPLRRISDMPPLRDVVAELVDEVADAGGVVSEDVLARLEYFAPVSVMLRDILKPIREAGLNG